MGFGSRLAAGVIGALLAAGAIVEAAEPDAQAAYEHRVDTMKRMGRALYTTIGRVVRGKAELDAQTVAAADSIVTLAATIETLFPPGSNVGDSRAKPEIFAAGARIPRLVAGVRIAADGLAAAAKAGDKATLASAAKTLDESCEACHRDFRKPE
jgi:cytochrome c556